MHRTPKPVRKCHGCPLNLIDRCGVFDDPHQQWKGGNCKGYKNDELHRQYLDDQAKRPPDPAKSRRRARAKELHSEPHHDGTRSHQSPFVGT
jgi:hypothetical protein